MCTCVMGYESVSVLISNYVCVWTGVDTSSCASMGNTKETSLSL